MNYKVVIVQPYVPEYRIGFFEALRTRLSSSGVDCTVAAGVPKKQQAERGDAARRDWLEPVNISSITQFGRSVDMRIDPKPWTNADAVIMGLEGSSLPVYHSIFEQSRGKLKVGLWGHVWPYSNKGNKLDLLLERYQMRKSNQVFAYTPNGAQYAVDQGIPASRVTTVMNTVDTTELRKNLDSITDVDLRNYKIAQGISGDRVVSYIGGLDKIKRIDFLSEVLELLWIKDPTIKLLVGGKGPDETHLEHAFRRRQAIQLGYLTGRNKALALTASRAICMPGGIGLIAVDALVARRPIITTDWPFHGPEAEYLVEGISRLTSQNNAESYAQAVIDACDSKEIVADGASSWYYPDIEAMVDNFARGVFNMLDV